MNTTIADKLKTHNQEHLGAFIELLAGDDRERLLDDIRQADFEEAVRAFAAYGTGTALGDKKTFDAAPVLRFDQTEQSRQERRRLHARGEEVLRGGRVGLFLVAGGQGTRLGFKGPKGCFPITPVRQKTLFQLFAETVLALRRRYEAALPWYIMTSRENNDQTVSFFRKHDFFGLGPDTVNFFVQKQIASLDPEGRLIVGRNRLLFKNPNGHGGSLYALRDSGALDRMRAQGIDEIFYFQVDNPLARIADPLFVGAHVDRDAEMSTKVVRKTDPAERVGIIGSINGRLGCIEYSELSPAQAEEKTPNGHLRFSSANTAIHMINRSFVERLTDDTDIHLPYHPARKSIECLVCRNGALHEHTIEGIKFEMFIFDALGFTRSSTTLEVDRRDEFSPVKNSSGSDSPETACTDMATRHRRWLEHATGLSLPDDFIVEISPLFALDEQGLKAGDLPLDSLTSPLYLG